MWLVLQITAMTVAASSGIFDQWVDKRVANHPRLFLAMFGVVSLPVAVIGVMSQPFVLKGALVGLVSGLCFSGALLLYYRAVALESIVVLALAGRLVAAIALPVNVLVFGESVSTMQMMLFGLLLISGWLLVRRRSAGQTCLSRGFWLMVGVEILWVSQDLLKNMLAIEYDAWMMLTWERAGIVLGALLVLLPRQSRAEVGQMLNGMATRWRVLLLCRPLAHILISLLAGLAVQSAGTVTSIVIVSGAYPFVVALLAWAVDGQRWSRDKSYRKRSRIYRVELFFGHCNSNGKPLRAQQIAEAEKWALESFSGAFHGAQLGHCMGGYQNSEGRFMIEPSTAIWSYTTQVPQAWLQVVANQIARVLEQECVLLCISTVDGTMTWIGQEPCLED